MRFNLSEWALNHRSFVVYCMIAVTIAGALAYSRLGRNEDPAFTFRTMVVQAAWPGASLEDTLNQVTERIERTLKETPNLDFVRSFTSAGRTTIFVNLKGSTPPSAVPDIWYHVRKSVGDMRHTLPAGVIGPGFNDEFGDTFGIIYGFTADGFTHRELRDYVEKLERVLQEDFPDAVTRTVPLELGPPVGWPVQYRISGPDLNQVRDVALRLAQLVASDARARQVNFDWIEPRRKVRIYVDQDQARLLGLSSEAIATVINTVMTGQGVTQVRDWIYLVDVLVRTTDEQRISLSTLSNLQFALPNGRSVPLGQFATLEFEREFPLIWRRDGVPTLTVQADVTPGTSPEAVVSALTPAISNLEATLPKSYHITVVGTVEESAQSQASVFAVVPLMLFITVTVLMMQLHSFSRLFLVLSVVPMGLIGIVATLLLFQKPLGFVATLGILALLGMIARNAVILIDQIEAERAEGREAWDAVVEGAMSRFRPIMLTAISTVLGMIPIGGRHYWRHRLRHLRPCRIHPYQSRSTKGGEGRMASTRSEAALNRRKRDRASRNDLLLPPP
jgi:multidrug efflux pump subunit AcrB